MLHRKFDMNRYNEKAQKFMKSILHECDVIGVRHINRGRYEDMVFVKWHDTGKISTVNLPQAHMTSSPCFGYDTTHLVNAIYCSVYGWKFFKICWWWDGRSCLRLERVINAMLENNID